MDTATLVQSTLDDWATVSTGIDTVPVLVGWVGVDTGALFVVLFAGLFTVLIGGYWRLRSSDRGQSTERYDGDSSAIETLKERYVNGDMDAVEFEQRLETLYEDAEGRPGETTKTVDSTRTPTTDRGTSDVASTDRSAGSQSRPQKHRGCSPRRGSKRRSKNHGCR